MKFWENLRGIISNLPLIFSDTYSVRDISINRLVEAVLLGMAWIVLKAILDNPDLAPALTPVLNSVLSILGAQLTANMVKRGIDTYKHIKGDVKKDDQNTSH